MSPAVLDQTKNRRAAIDIGSNSVKLLVADLADGVVTPLLHQGEQTRLGHGVYSTGRLQPEAIADTVRAAAAFAVQAGDQGAESIRVLATSAAREAVNADELTLALATHDLELEIIDGQTEAELIFRGVRSHPDFKSGPLAVIDVGGGSTEFLIADHVRLLTQQSFSFGTIRCLEQFPPSDPPTATNRQVVLQAVDEFLNGQVAPMIGDEPFPDTLIGAGGTPVFLARIQAASADLTPSELETSTMSRAEIQSLVDRLWTLPLAERRQLPGLSPNRADVILFGAIIYEAVMRRYDFSELRPTVRGVRYGAILE